MTPYKSKKRMGLVAILALTLVVVAAAGMLAAGCGGEEEESTTTEAMTETTAAAELAAAELNGAGATFPEPVYVEWIGGFQSANPQVKVNYQGVGSGAGIEQFTAQTTDFGGTDAYMKTEEYDAAKAARPGAEVYHIPTVFGSVVLAYNLPGVTELKLDSDTIAKIFLGTITKWNDPAIAALNEGVTLPDATIETVHRSDSSGTTNAFTSYLTDVSPDWAAGPGKGKEITWPVGVGAAKNAGVAGAITNTENSIGYVELAYAVLNNMTMASVKNAAGNFIVPSLESTSAAAELDVIPADMNIKVSNSAIPEAYPICTATYIIVYDKMTDPAKAEALKAFLTWSLGPDGTAIAEDLGYAPLPDSLREAALAIVEKIGQ
jgi:phosphate transport system substrate-binding protein